MRSPWIQFTRVAVLVISGFVLLDLIANLLSASSRGWPGGFVPYLIVVLAGAMDGLYWYFPVGVLAGAMAVTASDHVRPRRLAPWLGVALVLGCLTFVMNGYIGPHVAHHARLGLFDSSSAQDREFMSRVGPNDWHTLRAMAGAAPQSDRRMGMLTQVHGTVAFALMVVVVLPLGLVIGRGSRRFARRVRRRAAVAMAAVTTVAMYGAQAATWLLSGSGALPAVGMIYIGYLTAPVLILVTLAWAGTASSPWEPQRHRALESRPS